MMVAPSHRQVQMPRILFDIITLSIVQFTLVHTVQYCEYVSVLILGQQYVDHRNQSIQLLPYLSKEEQYFNPNPNKFHNI